MKKWVLLLTLLISNMVFGENLCIKVDAKSPELFNKFVKEIKEYSKKHYGVENFSIDKNSKTITGQRVFKVKKRRKNRMLIGTPVDTFKKKPKWKKEKIEIKGEFKNKEVCISVSLTAYNKRTKKWHKLKSDNLLEEHMIAFILTNSLKGRTLWSIGNISIDENGITKKVTNLTKFVVDSVDISIDPSSGIKSVNFNLLKGNNVVIYKVLMLGEVKDIKSALKVFKSHFLDFNPIKKTPKLYDYYWAYAKHGEIMDGMHKLQLITALGFPLKIVNKNTNKQIFVYKFDDKEYKYTIVNNELALEE